MNLSRYNKDLSLRELGPCTLQRALAEFELCYDAGLKKYEWFEDSMAAGSFCLSRSESDFIAVGCDGPESISITSDQIAANKGFFAKLIRSKDNFSISASKAEAIAVITHYFELSRDDFERKYQSFLTW